MARSSAARSIVREPTRATTVCEAEGGVGFVDPEEQPRNKVTAASAMAGTTVARREMLRSELRIGLLANATPCNLNSAPKARASNTEEINRAKIFRIGDRVVSQEKRDHCDSQKEIRRKIVAGEHSRHFIRARLWFQGAKELAKAVIRL